jgi:ATP-binding cassette subfamily C exporter for protease/lipase/ATP-binding cassette subfamily C protein EexD
MCVQTHISLIEIKRELYRRLDRKREAAMSATTMQQIAQRVRPFLLRACGYSFLSNLLLLVPAIYLLQVFDRVITSRSNETLLMLTLMAFGFLGAMAFFDMRRARLLIGAAVVLEKLAGPRLLTAMLSEAAQANTPDNVHALRDLSTLRAFLTGPGATAVFDAPWLPIYIVVIALFHPLLGVLAVFGGAALIALAWINERVSRKPVELLQMESRKSMRSADLCLRNAEVVKALGMQAGLSDAWVKRNRAVLELVLTVGCIGGRFTSWTKCARLVIQLSMIGTGALLVINQHTTSGVLIAAAILLSRALSPVESIVTAWKSLVEARSAYGRLVRILSSQTDAEHITELPVPSGALCVNRVVFGVRGQERPIINAVSFALAAGESLGIIGPSASGKSTLARLLLGIWRPLSGVVRLDGADVATWPRESLAAHVGYLPQDVELFSATVSENIARMGQIDDAAVIDAAKRAGAHEMILALPRGYDTQIGEAGCFLSGGQRQRIGLARALYGSPRLVVLDEPNANLDTDGEMALLAAIADLKRAEVSLIIVTHRPTMLGQIDKLLMLRDGRMELFGPRAQVMAQVAPGVVQVKPAPIADPIRLQSQG